MTALTPMTQYRSITPARVKIPLAPAKPAPGVAALRALLDAGHSPADAMGILARAEGHVALMPYNYGNRESPVDHALHTALPSVIGAMHCPQTIGQIAAVAAVPKFWVTRCVNHLISTGRARQSRVGTKRLPATYVLT